MGRSYVFSEREPSGGSSALRLAANFHSTGGEFGLTAGRAPLSGGAPRIVPEGTTAGADGDDDPPALLLNEYDDEDVEGGKSSTVTPFGSSRSTTPAASDDEVEPAAWAATATGDDFEDDAEGGTRIFRTREECYGTLMLCSQAGLTERGYNIVREFNNAGRPADAHLPYVTTVRERIFPRALKHFGLTRSVAPSGAVSYFLPSVHARRDFAFWATYDKFFRAEDRDELLREREPEFYDTSFFQHRHSVLMTCPQLTHFSLAGHDFWLGAVVDVCLVGNVVVHQACITEACYAGAGDGVGRDNGVHASDLVIKGSDASGAPIGVLVCRHWRPAGLDAMAWIASSTGAPVKAKAIHPRVVVAASTAAYGENITGAGGAPYPSPSATTRRTVRGMGADGIPTVTACASFYGGATATGRGARHRWRAGACSGTDGWWRTG